MIDLLLATDTHVEGVLWQADLVARTLRPPPQLVEPLYLLGHVNNLGKCKIYKSWTVMWNRNDLLHFRFRLWGKFRSSPARVQDPENMCTLIFNNKLFVQNLAFSMLEAALFSRKLASPF
jgi:hypothetical protein